jgi:hypothetical protein
MAAKKSRSYVIRVLRVLAESRQALSSKELWEKLAAEAGRAELIRWQKIVKPDALESALEELAKLRFVDILRHQQDGKTLVTYSIAAGAAEDVNAPALPSLETSRGGRGGDLDGGGGGRDGSNGAGAGNGGGGGLREVLEHGVLLCFDPEAFAGALDRSLEINPE